MLHPSTELRFVSPAVGYGIFATKKIPQGTITWVKDELDRVFKPEEVKKLSPANYENLMKYTYRDRHGDYFFCWDLTRYVNHSYHPNSMLTAMGFEIAIKDIEVGDEMTNDYGSFNIIEPFKCAVRAEHEREFVRPDDLLRFHKEWDGLISSSMKFQNIVSQPLEKFLTDDQRQQLLRISQGEDIPSVLENFFRG